MICHLAAGVINFVHCCKPVTLFTLFFFLVNCNFIYLPTWKHALYVLKRQKETKMFLNISATRTIL